MQKDSPEIENRSPAGHSELAIGINLRHRAATIVGSYILLAGLWIVFSDKFLGLVVTNKETIVTLSVYKGFAFIAVTALLLYLMLNRTFKLIKTAFHELAKKETERRQAEMLLRKANENLEATVEKRTHELKQALAKAESADRLKSAFLATMSHELRTPLNSIIGFSGILRQGLAGPMNPEQSKQLAMIGNSANHLLALINDILDLSKIEAGQLQIQSEPFNIKESIDKLVKLFSPMLNEKNLKLETKISLTDKTMKSDQRRVEQILMNLLSNAIKFTEKGKITLEAIQISDRVKISVIDTGIGIHKDDIASLFKPFSQIDNKLGRRFDGTGLGLSICQRLIEKLAGSIWVNSEPQKGSVFAFELPIDLPLNAAEEAKLDQNIDSR
jgi:signal transduction histidine kinase